MKSSQNGPSISLTTLPENPLSSQNSPSLLVIEEPLHSFQHALVVDSDVRVMSDVGVGVRVKGYNVELFGSVARADVRARHDLWAKSGARGDFHRNCHIVAGHDIQLIFADKATLRAGHDVDVEYALHSDLTAGRLLQIRGNIIGGQGWAGQVLLVRGDVGTDVFTPTELFLSSHPRMTRAILRTESKLPTYESVVQRCEPLAGHLPPNANDAARRLTKARRMVQILRKQLDALRRLKQALPEQAERAGIFVLGTLYPGVRVCIDGIRLAVENPVKCVRLSRIGDSIIITHLPTTV